VSNLNVSYRRALDFSLLQEETSKSFDKGVGYERAPALASPSIDANWIADPVLSRELLNCTFIEAGTLLVACAMTGGELRTSRAQRDYESAVCYTFVPASAPTTQQVSLSRLGTEMY
jgi:hypothetical protein